MTSVFKFLEDTKAAEHVAFYLKLDDDLIIYVTAIPELQVVSCWWRDERTNDQSPMKRLELTWCAMPATIREWAKQHWLSLVVVDVDLFITLTTIETVSTI